MCLFLMRNSVNGKDDDTTPSSDGNAVNGRSSTANRQTTGLVNP